MPCRVDQKPAPSRTRISVLPSAADSPCAARPLRRCLSPPAKLFLLWCCHAQNPARESSASSVVVAGCGQPKLVDVLPTRLRAHHRPPSPSSSFYRSPPPRRRQNLSRPSARPSPSASCLVLLISVSSSFSSLLWCHQTCAHLCIFASLRLCSCNYPSPLRCQMSALADLPH